MRALQGAQKVLQITRNIGTEFTPYLLDIATPSGADGLLALLHEHHFKCFDYLPPKHMASLPAWERPSDARGWVDALRRHGELGRKGNAKLKMQVEAKRAKKYQLKHIDFWLDTSIFHIMLYTVILFLTVELHMTVT